MNSGRILFLMIISIISFCLCYQWVISPSNTAESELTIGSFTPPAASMAHRKAIPNVKRIGKKVPQEWLDKIHKAAPGDDWKQIEARSIQMLLEARRNRSSSNLNGNWAERGPSNIPGRIVDIRIDYTNNRMYSISDHGIIFRSDDLEGKNWKALNDQHPLGLDVASQLEVFDDGNLVTTGWIKVDNYWGVYHSEDGGYHWKPSTGLNDNLIMGVRRMAKQNDTLYVFFQEHSPPAGTDYYVVYRSLDKGKSFEPFYQSKIPVGDGGRHRKSDMWVSNDGQDPNFYLMLEDSLFLVDKITGTRTFNSLVSNLAVEQGLLTGLTSNGVTHLTAYIAHNGAGKFYSWSTIDQTWTYKGEMTDWWLAFPFGSNSFSSSQVSPGTLYFGGILTSKSMDGGASWITMDLDPTNSYALYHGDVPKTCTTINPNTNKEEVYIGTDGGIYWMDEDEHFNTISVPGLNCTQIYKMVSRQSNPGEMFIGTQDNGYCHTNLGIEQPGIVDFMFQWGGDVSNVASGDGGETYWLWWLGDGCNYMTGSDQAFSTWTPYDFDGGVPYWEAPIWVSRHFPDRCYTAGFLNGASGNYIIQLQAKQGASATPTQFDYNFESEVGGKISALAISPLDSNYFYVATENGYFLASTDGGKTWSRTLLSGSMYPRVVHPSKVNLGEVWVGGSGYSNSPIFHTADNGSSFEDLNTGMPSCRVEAFASNEDESIIFAATSIGPFSYVMGEASWSDIAGEDAPIVQYMDVEYLTSTQTARFATYARGVWDFELMTTSTHRIAEHRKALSVFPNPAYNMLTINLDHSLLQSSFQIINSAGQVVRTESFVSGTMLLDISKLSPGVYFISNAKGNFKPVKFIKI